MKDLLWEAGEVLGNQVMKLAYICICYFRPINSGCRCSGTGRRTMRGEWFTGDIDDKEERRVI